MSVRFEIDYKEVEQLKEKFAKIPDKVEDAVNDVLHSYGIKTVKNHITDRIDVSKANKKHAKYSKPLKHRTFNLGFEIIPKKPYRYLVFPDQALGTSVGNKPDEFMDKGLTAGTDPTLQEINERIEKLIQEEI